MIFMMSIPSYALVFHVKANGSDDNDGFSWNTAFETITRAVGVAQDGDEIHVAAGTYIENIGVNKAFSLLGGYPAGGGENRDFKNNVTILDGNRNGISVIICSADAVIDGLAITNGYKRGLGAGIYVREYCNPTIKNCTLSQNSCYGGCGIHIQGAEDSFNGTIQITNCVFSENRGDGDGGGGLYVYRYNGSIIVKDCSFIENYAQVGGGIDVWGGAKTIVSITNCLFSKNTAQEYGGVIGVINSQAETSITIKNCTFVENAANGELGQGGAIYTRNKYPLTVANCTFYRNSSELSGSIFCCGGIITNCTFVEDSGTLRNTYSAGEIFCNSHEDSLHIVNSIFWNSNNRYLFGSAAKNPNLILTNCALNENFGYFFNSEGIAVNEDNDIYISDWLANHNPSEVTVGGVTHTVFALNENDTELISGGTNYNAPDDDQLGNLRSTSSPSIGAVEYRPDNERIYAFNGNKYKIFNESISWQEAREKCESLGGHLATITSKAESDFIQSFANEERSYWIGGTDDGSEGIWHWVTGEAFTFTNWNAGEPNNFDGKEHYLEFNGGSGQGRWNDTENVPLDSEGGRYYICEWDNEIALNVDVLESGKGRGISNIIQDIAEHFREGYLNGEGKKLDEAYLFTIPAENFSKKGFTADGNTRLILRAQSNKPGLIRFSVPASLDAKLESLSRDHWGTPSITIATTPVSDKVHQASAVLTAPEAYPLSMGLPSANFRLRTFFTADDGTTESNDLSLTVELTPVMLIHGLESNSVHAFRIGESQGVHHRLTQDGFYTDYWDYDGTKGPEDIFRGGGSSLLSKIADVLDVYKAKNIACTRVDIVAHSMGGLMAKRFLETNECYSARSYKQGMVRRIVTIATPHEGSPIANYFMKDYSVMNNSSFYESYILRLMQILRGVIKIGYESYCYFGKSADSAFRDLRINSPLTKRLKDTPPSVPVFVIYGKCKTPFNEYLDIVQHIIDGIEYMNLAVEVADMENLPKIVVCLFKAFIVDKVVGSFDPFDKGDAINKLKTVFTILYGDDDYDLMVGAKSALSIFEDADLSRTGLEYCHTSLCGQEDIGAYVSNLLRGSKSRFKDFSSYSALNVKAAVSSSANEPEDLPEEIPYEDFFAEHYTISSSISSVTVPGSAALTISSPEAFEYPIYISIQGNKGCKMMSISADGKTSEQVTLTFSSQDTGIMEVSCFSGSNEEKVYVSNNLRLAVTPALDDIEGIKFLHSDSVLYTNVGSELPLNVFAQKSDGSMFDISSPLIGTLWTTNNSSIAEVTSGGNLLGISEGTAKLTAAYKGFSASISIDVGPKISSSPESGEPEFSPDIKAPSITTNSLPDGQVSKSYSLQLQASGTTPIIWTHSESLPEGLTLSDSGLLAGIPAKSGKFSLTITASNSAGKASKTFTLTIKQEERPAPSVIAPSFITSFLPDGKTGTKYNELLSASGTSPITFTIISGNLPDGLNFSGGNISGIPTKAGNFVFNVRASNSAGSVQRQFTLKINSASSGNNPDDNDAEAPSIITLSLPEGTAGKYYSASISTSGTQPIIFTLSSGNLPEGIKFSDGHITGTPAETGTFTFTIRAENSAGHSEQEFTLKINNSSGGSPAPDPGHDEPSDPGQYPGDDITPDIVIMKKRTISNLSQSVINSLSNDKSIIAAVLPQIRINKSDAYDFDNIEILSAVPSESVLVWNAFASGDDNSYAQFFDKDGTEIQKVPAEHVINITAYLEAGETYAPVITAIRQSQNKHEEPSNNSGGSGGGGCNSCAGGIIISMLCVAVLRKN